MTGDSGKSNTDMTGLALFERTVGRVCELDGLSGVADEVDNDALEVFGREGDRWQRARYLYCNCS
jgi:hypothetical protein